MNNEEKIKWLSLEVCKLGKNLKEIKQEQKEIMDKLNGELGLNE